MKLSPSPDQLGPAEQTVDGKVKSFYKLLGQGGHPVSHVNHSLKSFIVCPTINF